MESAATRTSAPYGRACVNCVKAKCRCMISDRHTCERCHRLEKECTPSTLARKRGPKITPASKRSKLEDKLDEVVLLLRTQHTAAPTVSPDEPFVLTPDSFIPASTVAASSAFLTEGQLLEFRDYYLTYFPFMYMPHDVTAESLRLDHPILYLAIQTVCTKAMTRQSQLSKKLREVLASNIIVNGERSMDLLQGLIVSIAWSTYFTHGKQFMGAMCGLARSLVNDIRLDKPVNSSGCPSIGPPGHVENKEARTNEGSKALLAVFTLSAYISMAFRSDPMAWSTQIEEACDMLSKNIESERDDILVTTARLARIVLSATEISRRALDDPTTAQYAMMAIEPLKLTLSTFKSTLTPGYHQHRSIISLIHSAEVSIYELALSQPPSPTSLSPYNQLPLDLKRIEYLTALLQTCKASKDHFLAGGLASITVPSMLIFPYCIKILHRLSTFKDVPGWDPTIVKQTVDIMQCLEQAAAMAERLNANFKEGTGENSIFAAAAENLRASAHNWSVPVSSEQDEGVGDSASFGTWNGGDGVDFPMADFSDDFWLPGTFNF